ncbi:hypothetical protein [Helcococcus kunzii]|uniref:hypothetical protein n=1 Tax=Helcococcus kunzii TaxID=40091 RepID=UPI0038A4449F
MEQKNDVKIDLKYIDDIFALIKDISNLNDRISYLDDELQCVGGFSTNERVQTSLKLNDDRKNYLIDEKNLLAKRISKKMDTIKSYQDELKKVLPNIIDDKERDVLRYRYIFLSDISQIAEIMQYSETQVRRFLKYGQRSLMEC